LHSGDDAAEHGKTTADRLPGSDDCSRTGRSEGFLGSLPLVLAIGTVGGD
jgi:hypothetical protein